MNDRGLTVAVSILAIILLVLIATVTIQKGIIERDTRNGLLNQGVSKLDLSMDSINPSAYSLQQAYALCKRDAVKRGGNTLLSLNYDADSSRYLASENAFLVFLDANIRQIDEDRNEFVVCKVSASTNKIVEFRMKPVKGIWGGM